MERKERRRKETGGMRGQRRVKGSKRSNGVKRRGGDRQTGGAKSTDLPDTLKEAFMVEKMMMVSTITSDKSHAGCIITSQRHDCI